jgi:Periplasmic copper-binding protein (NosD)
MSMLYKRILVTTFCFLAGTAFADSLPLDCTRKSLADSINSGREKSITFTGICSGPIVIRTDGLTLTGVGTAIIDGGGQGQDAVTVKGIHGVSLANLEIRNGKNGIIGVNGAHISLNDVNVHDNQIFGISLQTASSAIMSNVTTNNNGVHGLDLETGSAGTITGPFTSSDNRVFGINANGSSLTFSLAKATISGNALGIQVATGANAFLNDSKTVLNLTDNLATGLTIVSGGHMVSFGGTIIATGNPVNGVSLNSKAGLDLDAGSLLKCDNNGDGLLLQENSVMTVFNIPQFSGVPGFSTVACSRNRGNGVKLRSSSTLTLSNQAQLNSTQNGAIGLVADDGVGATLVNSAITGNTGKDIQLTFGSRVDLQTLTFGSYSCDATVLVRGTSGISCPH